MKLPTNITEIGVNFKKLVGTRVDREAQQSFGY
jgi:hypothetical protein